MKFAASSSGMDIDVRRLGAVSLLRCLSRAALPILKGISVIHAGAKNVGARPQNIPNMYLRERGGGGLNFRREDKRHRGKLFCVFSVFACLAACFAVFPTLTC